MLGEEHAAKVNKAVREQIQTEITAHGLHFTPLARTLGISSGVLQRYMAGSRQFPMTILWVILDFIGLPVEVFFSRVMSRLDS
jgi:transcriptional regulator with XRE-family HTH domain